MGSNFLTSIQVGCLAAPEWVLTNNKKYFDSKNILIENLELFNNTSNGFKNQTKLQGGVRGSDQHGVLRQLRLHVHVHLLRQGRRGLQGHGGFLQEVLDEEREHGEKLIQYENKRGGKV